MVLKTVTGMKLKGFSFVILFSLFCSQGQSQQPSFFPASIGINNSRILLEVDAATMKELFVEGAILTISKWDLQKNEATEDRPVNATLSGNQIFDGTCTPRPVPDRFICNLRAKDAANNDVPNYFVSGSFYSLEVTQDVTKKEFLFLACNPSDLQIEQIEVFEAKVLITDIDSGVCTNNTRHKLQDRNGLEVEAVTDGFGVKLENDLSGVLRLSADAKLDQGFKLKEANVNLDVDFRETYELGTVLGTDIPNYYPIRIKGSAGFQLGDKLSFPISVDFTFGVPMTDNLINIYHNAVGIERSRFPMLVTVGYTLAPVLSKLESTNDKRTTHQLLIEAQYNIPILQRTDLELDWKGTWLIADGSFENNLGVDLKVFFLEGYDTFITFGIETGADAPLFTDATTIKVGYSTAFEALLGSFSPPKAEE